MPEGPELFLASIFINTVSNGRFYGGQVEKSEVSIKNPDVHWNYKVYRVSAVARGKELKVTLHEGNTDRKGIKTQDIVFNFGMSGSFKYTAVSELPKHAHLRFYTINENPPMVLSFVDYRRFGRWRLDGNWDAQRGPDPMWEYQCFRENVLANLMNAAFNKPICEALLNQKFFNGIGNYLRAEILFRCGIRPFDPAREVLVELKSFSQWYEGQVKLIGSCIHKPENISIKEEKKFTIKKERKDDGIQPDILDLCHIVPKEVINLSGGGKGYNVDPDADEEEYAAFREWLRCYYQEGMKNMVDHNKRTIWFAGEPGKLVPKDTVSRSMVKRKQKIKTLEDAKEYSGGKKKPKVVQAKKQKAETKEKISKTTVKKTPKGKAKTSEENFVKSETKMMPKVGAKKMEVAKTKKKMSVKTTRKALKGKLEECEQSEVTSEYFTSTPNDSQRNKGRVSKALATKISKVKDISTAPVRRSTRRLSS